MTPEVLSPYQDNPYQLFTSPEAVAPVVILSHNVDKRQQHDSSSTGFASATYPGGTFREMFYHPSADTDETLYRQSVITSLVEDQEATTALLRSSLAAGGLVGSLGYLTKIPKSEQEKQQASYSRGYLPRGKKEYSPKNNLQLYMEAIKGLPYDDIDPEALPESVRGVHTTLGNINQLRGAVNNWAHTVLPAGPHEFFQRAAAAAQGLEATIPDCRPQTILAKSSKRDFSYVHGAAEAAKATRDVAEHTIAVTEFAHQAINGNYVKVEITKTGSPHFVAGTNITKAAMRKKDSRAWEATVPQVPNDSLPDKPVRVLAGANMTGKSFAMETHLFEQLVAQAFGYAPAESATTRPMPSIAFVDRSSTDAGNDLSAFGSEVRAWSRALDSSKTNGVLYADEAFSTTSPHEQSALIVGATRYLAEQGIQTTLATHNEEAVAALAGRDDTSIHHLGFRMEDGKPVYSHRIEAGSDDSHALEVAAGRLLLPKVIDMARSYLDGNDLGITRRRPGYPGVEAYTEDERESLKQAEGDLRCVFTNTEYLLTDTEGRSVSDLRRWGYLRRMDEDRYYGNGRDELRWVTTSSPLFVGLSDDDDLNWSLRHRWHELGEKLLKDGGITDARVLQERQRFYSAFADPELADALTYEVTSLGMMLMMTKDMLQGRIKGIDELFARSIDDIKEIYDHSLYGREYDLSYLLEVVSLQLDVRGLTEEEAGLRAEMTRLRTLQTYFDTMDSFGADGRRDARMGTPADQEYGRLKDDYYKDNKDKMVELAQEAGAEVHVFEYENIVHRYANADDVFKKTLVDALSKLKTLPKVTSRQLASQKAHRRINQTPERFHSFSTGQGDDHDRRVMYQPAYLARNLIILGQLTDPEPFGSRLANKLRQIDSVVAHQLAGYTERVLRAAFSGRANGPELLADIRSKKTGLGLNNMNPWLAELEVRRMRELMMFAAQLTREGFTPVEFTDEGEIEIEGGWNPLKEPHEQVANDISIGNDEAILLVTGANMSGKTHALKQIATTQLFAQSTGMVPAKHAKLPLFERVIYLDRADTSSANEGLSAYGTELERWKRALAESDKKGTPTLILADEAFSTTSPTYQEGLTAAVATHFARRGALGGIATHNHAVVDRLTHANPDVFTPIHFKTDVDTDGAAVFSYELEKGHDQSKALAVARAIGGLPPAVLDYAEDYLATRHTS